MEPYYPSHGEEDTASVTQTQWLQRADQETKRYFYHKRHRRSRVGQHPPQPSLLPRQLIHHLPPAHKRLAYAPHSRFDIHVTRMIFRPIFRQLLRVAVISRS